MSPCLPTFPEPGSALAAPRRLDRVPGLELKVWRAQPATGLRQLAACFERLNLTEGTP